MRFSKCEKFNSQLAEVRDVILRENFVILGIVETWLTSDVDNSNITIDGYTIVRADRETRGGGVALYLKNNLRYDVLNIPSTNELEQRWSRTLSCPRNYDSAKWVGLVHVTLQRRKRRRHKRVDACHIRWQQHIWCLFITETDVKV
nr:unnamed protein product [Callosobruchus analis]